MSTTHFKRPSTTKLSVLSVIETTARRFGIESPAAVSEVDQALAAEPTVNDTLAAAVADSLGAEDADKWLDQAVSKIARAQAVEALKSTMVGRREMLAAKRAPQAREDISEDVAKVATTAIKKLTTAAQKLPAGTLALDAEAVIAANAATERTDAIAALSDLGALSGIYETTAPPAGVSPHLGAALPVLDLPEVEVELTNGMSTAALNPCPQRDALRQLSRDADKGGTDQVVIDVARGAYPGVTLAWAPTAAAVRERVERARTSTLARRAANSSARTSASKPARIG